MLPNREVITRLLRSHVHYVPSLSHNVPRAELSYLTYVANMNTPRKNNTFEHLKPFQIDII